MACGGALVGQNCWILSEPGESCAAVCHGLTHVDAEATLAYNWRSEVVHAIQRRYSLDATIIDGLDEPCHGSQWSIARSTALFVYVPEGWSRAPGGRWHCFAGQSLSHVSPVVRAATTETSSHITISTSPGATSTITYSVATCAANPTAAQSAPSTNIVLSSFDTDVHNPCWEDIVCRCSCNWCGIGYRLLKDFGACLLNPFRACWGTVQRTCANIWRADDNSAITPYSALGKPPPTFSDRLTLLAAQRKPDYGMYSGCLSDRYSGNLSDRYTGCLSSRYTDIADRYTDCLSSRHADLSEKYSGFLSSRYTDRLAAGNGSRFNDRHGDRVSGWKSDRSASRFADRYSDSSSSRGRFSSYRSRHLERSIQEAPRDFTVTPSKDFDRGDTYRSRRVPYYGRGREQASLGGMSERGSFECPQLTTPVERYRERFSHRSMLDEKSGKDEQTSPQSPVSSYRVQRQLVKELNERHAKERLNASMDRLSEKRSHKLEPTVEWYPDNSRNKVERQGERYANTGTNEEALNEQGVLSVTIHKAVGLRRAAATIVIASVGSQQKRTAVVSKSADPHFQQVLEFDGPLEAFRSHSLLLKVVEKHDSILSKREETMGEVGVSLDAMREGENYSFTESLAPQGDIIFEVKWRRINPGLLSRGTLQVHLSHATNLKSMDRNGFSDPYVKISLHGTMHKSRTIKKTLNPIWDERFEFKGVLRDLTEEPLLIQAYDHDFGSRDDQLGTATVDLRPLENVHQLEVDAALSLQGRVHLNLAWIPDDDAPSARGLPITPVAMCPTNSPANGCVHFHVV
ncbi:hypothetical protein AB1Y20_002440 [Prymnesium parvum]|uniref:C2 domain-containing protein n=1 Tax=Prymnesium parvum TaxID=97485 RepID=A0AB34J985_PRYPA